MIHIDWGNHNHNLPDWNDWLRSVGLGTTPTAGPHFNLSSMAIEAAVQGKGVLLGQHGLIADELHNGQLVRLSNIQQANISLPLGQAYFIAYPKRTLDNPNAVAFLNWLKQYK